MKKLSALIIGICLIGFLSTNASAGPCDCGYIFDLGPGTLTQQLNIGTTPITPLGFTITSACGAYSMAQTLPETGCNDDTETTPFYVLPGPDGTYGTTDDTGHHSLIVQKTDWGTATVSDYRDMPGTGPYTCDVTIDNARYSINFIFDTTQYTSAQTDTCGYDWGATHIPNEAASGNTINHRFTGYVTAKPEVGVVIEIVGVWNYTDFSGLPVIVPVHDITNVRVEYFSRLRGDLNNDGFVDGSDLGIFAGDWGQSKACSCNSYFP